MHKEALRKDVEKMTKRILHNPQVSLEDIVEWHKKVKKAKEELDPKVNQYFGVKGGGKGKREWGSDKSTKDEKIKKRKKGLTG